MIKPLKNIILIFFLIFFCSKQNSEKSFKLKSDIKIPDTIVVASYNVENLFDMEYSGNEYKEYIPNKNNWNYNTYSIKLNNISDVISQINPHIAVLLEIESKQALKDLCNELKRKKTNYEFQITSSKDNVYLTAVIISKFPPIYKETISIDSIKAKYQRDMLRADILIGGDTLSVFACHWPSKAHKESTRLINAKVLKDYILRLPPQRDIIICGDLNEDYNECEIFNTLGLNDTKGCTGLNHILGTVISKPNRPIEFLTKKHIINKTYYGFFDPWIELDESKRMSTVYKGMRQTLDHILLSQNLFDDKYLSYVNNSFCPFTWNGRLLKNNSPYRWEIKHTKYGFYHTGYGYSDHLPVIARFCRCPYFIDKEDTMLNNAKGEIKTGNFETGFDGWVICSKNVHIKRDSSNSVKGKYSLFVYGKTFQNSSFIKTILKKPKCETENLFLSFYLKGKGTLCLRVKPKEDEKWIYFTGENFFPRKSGKYFEYDFLTWKYILIPLNEYIKTTKEIYLEIRSKKDTEFKLWVDDIKIICKNN
jgi:exonuclease III